MEVRKLTVGYGAAWVLDQVSLQIGAGEFVGIVGCTGCGKTTLLKAMAGLLEVQSGEILLDGENIFSRRFDRAVLRRKVGMVFQYPEYQLFAQTVEKDVGFGLKYSRLSREEKQERVRWALEQMGFSYEEIKDQSPLSLSGGEKRRVAIAGVLATKPELLMLDEPLAGLDPMAREMFLEFLERTDRAGRISCDGVPQPRRTGTACCTDHWNEAGQNCNGWKLSGGIGRQQGASDDRTARQRSSADRGAFAGKRCAAGGGGKAERAYTCASGRDGKRSRGRKEDSAGQRASRYL
ncbi:energy-coupling factor ABC transporter ATP-binding protein [Gallintestinimicrobium sp.]|uniref:energy-coupling factor ABC transporter ATP-binding protein n=1 Tax=Gallintestinimicrobium sp. TaxID=2981655 RepID=UPI003991540C